MYNTLKYFPVTTSQEVHTLVTWNEKFKLMIILVQLTSSTLAPISLR